jgi:glycosyltransferase involved in cell wall biosynthesis
VYVALTQHGRHKFIEGGLPAERIVVKPNFVYPDPGPGTGSGGYALFVGRLSAEKGLETLLAAWKHLAGRVPLTIVGDGPLAATVAGDPSIRWLGSRPIEEVYTLLGEAMFLVLPSRCYETFGRVAIEAFACGTPVIASRLGAMAELVEHGRTGLHFEAGDAAGLAAQVQRLLADPDERQRLRTAARQEFELRYTAESNYRALRGIYEKALRTAGGPS